MGLSWTTPVRGVQLVVAIIVLGLSGYLVSKPFAFDSRYGFNVFTALWTILVAAFFLVVDLVMKESFLANAIIRMVLDGLSWLFWLAAFACVAAILNAADEVDDATGLEYPGQSELRALVAFGVIEWLLFTATTVWTAISSFRGNKAGGAPAHQGV